MAPSNSLLSNLSANNVQLNRADIRNLNVRNNGYLDRYILMTINCLNVYG